jgi:hypothetical protein
MYKAGVIAIVTFFVATAVMKTALGVSCRVAARRALHPTV